MRGRLVNWLFRQALTLHAILDGFEDMWEDCPIPGPDPAGGGTGPAGGGGRGEGGQGGCGCGGEGGGDAVEAWRRRQQWLIEALHGVVATFDRKVLA